MRKSRKLKKRFKKIDLKHLDELIESRKRFTFEQMLAMCDEARKLRGFVVKRHHN
ncbi:MAG: hypothetical protein HY929_00510 [Euryarchaeota archaeon]|nr:hypothetical protein [Euryarchaeota archaeon]